MTISIKPTSSGSTIEQDGGTILSVDGSGNLTVPNNITFSGTVTGVSSGEATLSTFVNFNAQSSNAIRASANVSSITDNGAGNFTINFTTAYSDTGYTISAHIGGHTVGYFGATGSGATGGGTNNTGAVFCYITTISTSSVRINTAEGTGNDTYGSGDLGDFEYNFVTIFR